MRTHTKHTAERAKIVCRCKHIILSENLNVSRVNERARGAHGLGSLPPPTPDRFCPKKFIDTQRVSDCEEDQCTPFKRPSARWLFVIPTLRMSVALTPLEYERESEPESLRHDINFQLFPKPSEKKEAEEGRRNIFGCKMSARKNV
jgi:hypothetical protein